MGSRRQPPPPPPPPPAPPPPRTDARAAATPPPRRLPRPRPNRRSPTVTVKGGRLGVPGNIVYETGKAVIKPESEPTLNALKNFMEQNKNFTRIRIEGHTDNVGKPADNMKLSTGSRAWRSSVAGGPRHRQGPLPRGRVRRHQAHRRQQDRRRQGPEPPHRVPHRRNRGQAVPRPRRDRRRHDGRRANAASAPKQEVTTTRHSPSRPTAGIARWS